ncbi:serine/threonine-protein kinase [Phytomonospora sp. NPDC050363]|uniref:serine/threonine-protein kinase n=1 Tax=Phytomonospora sp. NPDC050363 TaxID=3155642 RepID=UPI0033C53E14
MDRLLEAVVADEVGDSAELRQFRDYLQFKARGIPRRLLQEFNSFVSWEENRPVARVADHDLERVAFYADLESIVGEHLEHEQSRRSRMLTVEIDHDRRRLAAYHLMDWVLRSEGEPFASSDLVHDGVDVELDPLLRTSQRGISRLLAHLEQHRVIEYVRRPDATVTIIEGQRRPLGPIYKLSADVRRVLFGLAASNEGERAALLASAPSGTITTDTGIVAGALPPSRVLADRYELHDVIGQGGMGTVYRAYDRQLERPVAVKTLRYFDRGNSVALARLRREAQIALKLDHPQIVRTYDAIEPVDDEHGAGAAIIMELMDGPDLTEVVRTQGPLPEAAVRRVGRQLASTLSYLQREKVIRIDLKPSNIVIDPRRGPVIFDFGIARQEEGDSLTSTGDVIGTPTYMAPEVILGLAPDHRTDIHALGLVLYFCAAGRAPWDAQNATATLYRLVNEDIDVSELPVSTELRQIIAKAASREPDERFQNAEDMEAALAVADPSASPDTS